MRDPLIEALVRGFPSWEDRHKLARAAKIEDPQLTGEAYAVWEGLVDEALAQGRTHALAKAIDAAGRPRLAAALEEGGLPDSRPRWAVLGAVLMGSALFLFLFYVTLDPGQREVDARMSGPRPSALADADTTPPPLAPDAPAEDEPGDAAVEAEPGAQAAPEPEGDVAEGEPTGWGTCRAAPGERIGYAYAGTVAPADPWRPEGRVNVRADYPRPGNGWATRSPTVCILPTDAVVRLVERPIAVDGGAFYVPIMAPKEGP